MPTGARSTFDVSEVGSMQRPVSRVTHHRHPYPLRSAHAGRSFRRRGEAARNPGGQTRGDELSRSAGGIISRDVGFRPPTGGLRQGWHHGPDHQQSVRGRGDRGDRQQARDRRREACQRPERGDRGACTGDELGPGHAQSARGEPHRRRRALPRAPRLQRPADHVKLARPVPRHRGRLSVLGMGTGPASADLHPSAAGTDRTRPADGSVQARRTRGASVRHRHGARPHDSVGSVRPLSTR